MTIEFADELEKKPLKMKGSLDIDPKTGHFIATTEEHGTLEFSASALGGLESGYKPHNIAATVIQIEGGPTTSYHNVNVTLLKKGFLLTGGNKEIIRYYNPQVTFSSFVKYPKRTADKIYGETTLYAVNPVNGQAVEVILYDVGCGCSVERIEKKVGKITIRSASAEIVTETQEK